MRIKIVPFEYQSPLFMDAVHIYCDVWGRDKENSEIFFRRYVQLDGYIGYVARADNQTVGFAFGTASQAGQWWHDKVAQQVGRSHPALQNAWVLTELAVLEAYRNQKIGHLLLTAVMSSQDYTNALLSTQIDNEGAKRFYEKRGWAYLHRGFAFNKGRREYCIMHRDMTYG